MNVLKLEMGKNKKEEKINFNLYGIKLKNGIIMMPIIIEVLKAEVTGNLKRNYLNTGLLIIKI